MLDTMAEVRSHLGAPPDGDDNDDEEGESVCTSSKKKKVLTTILPDFPTQIWGWLRTS